MEWRLHISQSPRTLISHFPNISICPPPKFLTYQSPNSKSILIFCYLNLLFSKFIAQSHNISISQYVIFWMSFFNFTKKPYPNLLFLEYPYCLKSESPNSCIYQYLTLPITNFEDYMVYKTESSVLVNQRVSQILETLNLLAGLKTRRGSLR